MGIIDKSISEVVDGVEVRVSGRSGLVKPLWQLWQGNHLLDQVEPLHGEHVLTGTLSTGAQVGARVKQNMFGPCEVQFLQGDKPVGEVHKGFLL